MLVEKYKLLSFDSTHHALQAEELLKPKTDSLMMVPVPPEINADCGLAVKLKSIAEGEVIDLVEDNNIQTTGLYQIEKKEFDTRIKRLS